MIQKVFLKRNRYTLDTPTPKIYQKNKKISQKKMKFTTHTGVELEIETKSENIARVTA